MWLLRSPLTRPPLLCEVHPQLEKSLRKTINMSKKRRPDPQNSSRIHRPLVIWCNRYVGKEPHVKVQDSYLPSF